MSNDFVRVPPDSTGKRIDNSVLIVDGNPVYRQRIALGDGTSNNLASVDANGNIAVANTSVQSTLNTTIVPLADADTYTGDYELNGYPDVQVSCITDKAGTLYFDFSVDGTNTNTFPTAGFAVSAGIHEFHNAVKGARYFRVRFVNGATGAQTYLRLYTYFGQFRQGNLPLNQSISSDADSIVTRSVLVGADQIGVYRNIRADVQGNIKVAIGNPVSAFGELLTAYNHPIYQINGVYGLSSRMRTSATGAGAAAGVSSNDFYATSGTASTGNATVFTKEAAVYKSGQGLSFPFTARWGTPLADAVTFAGPQNGSDRIVMGYNGLTFGLWFGHWGQHEIRTLTVTTPSSGSTNATIVIGGTSYTVPLTPGTVAFNAKEIADSLTSQTALFSFYQVDSRVVCRSSSARVVTNTFSFTHATAVAAWSTQSTGVALTEDFTAATDFTEGNLLSWLDPTKGNVFRVDIQYLGYGDIDIYAEYSDPKEYILIHRIHYANENIRTSVTNPSFRVGWTAGNRGSTSPVTVYGASAAAFTQGEYIIGEQERSYTNSKTNSGETIIFMLKVADVLDGKVNISPTQLQSISVTTESTKGCIFKMVLNPTIATGTTNYAYVEEDYSTSLVDIAATTLTGGRVINTLVIGGTGSRDKSLIESDIHLYPSDVIAITAAVTSGAASLNTVSLGWKEDI